MEAVLLIGVQGSGKTTFYRERFFDTHVRVSRDMLGTRHRQRLLIAACLEGRQPFVVDDTNAARGRRAEHIAAAKAAGFRVLGFFFQTSLADALRRNRERPADRVIPAAGVAGTYKRFEPPQWDEGFDELHTVMIALDGRFEVRELRRGEASPR
jgi:tRNA uridine 5-carbamoylmethylation protein Kti12